jgi:P27 family predicted phage terminase small subunit
MPNVLRLATGNAGRRPINLADGVNPDVAVPQCPPYLSVEAKKEWKAMGAELAALGLIAEIDKAAFLNYCDTYGDLVLLLKAKAGKKSALLQQEGKEEVDWFFFKTPTGFERASALANQIEKTKDQLNKYLAPFGMSASARMRVHASVSMQPQLPGVGDKPTWGAIANGANR